MAEAFPLDWPAGWPRAVDRKFSLPAGNSSKQPTWNKTVERLMRELRLLGAEHVVLSTNQQLRRDGLPYQAPRRIEDPGVAVYFQLKGRALVMAQDGYWDMLDNMRSLALALEGLRQMERHGGGHMMDRASQGFAALPGPKDWRKVLGFGPDDRPGIHSLMSAYREEAKKVHPDVGGTDAQMAELNAALTEARAELA